MKNFRRKYTLSHDEGRWERETIEPAPRGDCQAEIWGAVIGVIGAVGGGYLASQGASRAANAQAGASADAIAEQRRQFNTLLGLTANQRAIGNQALSTLGGVYGYQPAPTNQLAPSYYGGYGGGSGASGGGMPVAPGDAMTPWSAGGLTGITMDEALASGNIFRLASNPVGAIGAALGVKSDSTLGKILDPAAMLGGRDNPEEQTRDAYYAQLMQGAPTDSKLFTEGLVGEFRGSRSTYAPRASGQYGPKDDDKFAADLAARINAAYRSGAITDADDAGSIYTKVVEPWFNSMGGGASQAPEQHLALTLDMVNRYINGQPITWQEARGGRPEFAVERYAGDPRAAQTSGGGRTYEYMPDGSVREIIGPPTGGGNELAAGAPGSPQAVPNYEAFYRSPDYQFRLNEGLNAVQNSAAARGGLYSGNALRGLTEYGQGVAGGAFNDWFQNNLALAGIGTGATSQAGQGALATGANVGNLLVGAGNARASGIIDQTNALTGTLNQLGLLAGSGAFGGWGGFRPNSMASTGYGVPYAGRLA